MIKPIETHYAGCRFRSRLEARWAVFFDTLRVKWEYEREGYEVFDRLRICGTDEPWYYLPDFWLPDYDIHAEVKGSLDEESMRKLLSAIGHLSSPDGGCRGGNGHDTLLLGPIPRITSDGISEYAPYPSILHLHKGDMKISPWRTDNPCWGSTIADDVGGEIVVNPAGLLTGCGAASSLYGGSDDAALIRGYAAARSARFEHGERG